MYKISVITPVYNGEAFITDTLNTLMSSDISDVIQFVLVDDGSGETCRQLLQELDRKYESVKLVRKENGGIASARNAGIDAADGDYICFCDHDDVVEPQMYGKLLRCIEDGNYDLSFCGTHKYIDGQKIPLEVFEDRDYSREQIYSDIIHSIMFYGSELGRPVSERWVGSIWKGIYRRDIILKNNIRFRRHYNYEDDLLFFVEYAVNCTSAASISYSGYGWRINPESETHNWKYIDDFKTKYMNFVEDITSLISKSGCGEEDLSLYRNLLMCQFMTEYVTNEGSVFNKAGFPAKISNIRKARKILTHDDFAFRRKVVKSYTRTRWALFFLNYNMVVTAYAWLVGTRKIREGALRKK